MLTLLELRKIFIPILEFDNELKEKSYFVGGCVRDYLRQKTPNDIDIVINIKDGSIKFCEAIYTFYKGKVTKPCRLGNYPILSITFKDNIFIDGIKYNTKGILIEVADTMKEEYHDVNSRQRYVEFSTLEDDIARRDFTINSGLMNIYNGTIEELTSTSEDIKKKLIRCNPNVNKDKIFSDDPLRILRGLVFSIRFNYKIEKDTEKAMIRNRERLRIVARERINKEMDKVFNIEHGAYKIIKYLDRLGMLEIIAPHIARQKEIYQWNIKDNKLIPDSRGIHLEGPTVFHHTLNVLKYTKKGTLNALCSIFHDIGKTKDTREQLDNGIVSFKGHDEFGAKNLEKLLKNFYKIDGEIAKKVTFVCKFHMRVYKLHEASDKAIRRFIRDTQNDDNRKLLYELCIADTKGTKKSSEALFSKIDKELISRINNIAERQNILQMKKKKILSGNDIMELFNLKQGKEVGRLLSILEDIEDEFGESLTKDIAIDELFKRSKA